MGEIMKQFLEAVYDHPIIAGLAFIGLMVVMDKVTDWIKAWRGKS